MINNETQVGESQIIFDVVENDFIEKVIEQSENKLIVVDFWAPWCGPCKQLGPVLENVVKRCGGRVLLAKINIDENQQIASQLRIQSIPTVMAFNKKKIADAFQGVIPENKIIEFIEKSLGEKIKKDNSEFYSQIEVFFNNKNYEEALTLLEDFIADNSDDISGIKLYLNCLLGLSRFEEAKSFIESLSEELQKTDQIKSFITQINLKESNKDGPEISEIEINFKKNPNNLDIAIELSEKYFSNDMIEKSFDLLLNIYSKNDEKNKDKIKKIFLKYFDALGNESDHTKNYRKKLSTIMFS